MVIDIRAQMKASLQTKTKESYECRDDSGQFKNIFKDEFSNKLWKCGEGEHLLDIIPYPAGKHDPKSKEGEWGYLLDIWVHYGIGVNQDAYVCPARNYGQPCPICEYREEVRRQDDYDEDLVKELTPKRRSIYNIICYNSEKEESKGVQIFDSAHWFMEKHISSLAKTPARGVGKSTDSYIAFSDPDEGKSISFTRKGTKRNSEFLGHKFVDRNYIIPDEVLNTAFILDESINICSYDEIKNAFMGGPVDAAPVEEAPAPVPPPVQEGGLKPRRTMPAASVEPSPAVSPRVRTNPAATVSNPICPVAGGAVGVDL